MMLWGATRREITKIENFSNLKLDGEESEDKLKAIEVSKKHSVSNVHHALFQFNHAEAKQLKHEGFACSEHYNKFPSSEKWNHDSEAQREGKARRQKKNRNIIQIYGRKQQ